LPCKINGKDCIDIIAEMKSKSNLGYVAIIVVSLLSGLCLCGVGLFFFLKFIKMKKGSKVIKPTPSPEKNENLH
jgi:hypothetical protein